MRDRSASGAATSLEQKYVLVFKTHAWDDFIERQFERYRSNCLSGDVVILADETNRPLGPIPYDRVIRTTNSELLQLGLANAYGKGGLIWWNTDYPNYLAADRLPEYDYYLFVEYDSCANLDIDSFVEAIAANGADAVALPTRQAKSSWYWTKFHERVYSYEEICGSLNCISVFSARAMQLLLARRRAHTIEHNAGRLRFWPGNEVFIATEINRAGYKFASLEEFGDATQYEWHPPILEDDLYEQTGTFLHPVLDRPRYIASLLKFEFDLSSYFISSSPLRRQLARFPARDYLPHMPAAFRRQVLVKLRQALGAI
jgi:hypothetical protein